MSETDQSDQESDRLLAIIDRRNRRTKGMRETNRGDFRGDVTHSRSNRKLNDNERRNDVRFRDDNARERCENNDTRRYVNDVRFRNNNGDKAREERRENNDARRYVNDVKTNRRDTAGHSPGPDDSYASVVVNESGPSRDTNYDSEPIHERISRRNSRKNIHRAQPRNQPTRQADLEELEMLRSKVRTYEAQTTNNNPTQPPKNGEPARREAGQNQNELSEMRNYLAGVMSVIRGFDNKLSSQLEQPPTPSDSS